MTDPLNLEPIKARLAAGVIEYVMTSDTGMPTARRSHRASCPDILSLIAEVERLRAERARWEDQHRLPDKGKPIPPEVKDMLEPYREGLT